MKEPLDGDLHMALLGDILAELRQIKEDLRWLKDREQETRHCADPVRPRSRPPSRRSGPYGVEPTGRLNSMSGSRRGARAEADQSITPKGCEPHSGEKPDALVSDPSYP